MNSFDTLGLSEPLGLALEKLDYTTPTPIQAQAIPLLLDGQDLLGMAQTGTGKTAAFALPMLNAMCGWRKRPEPRKPRMLVLAPTRELAVQIETSFKQYGRFVRFSCALVVGGVSQQPQTRALSRGVDLLVATPGRLMDLMEQGHAFLDKVECFVLDEADRMLDMGFMPAIRKIAMTLPKERQTLLFSATMPADVKKLSMAILNDPVEVSVAPTSVTADNVEQRVLFVERSDKRHLLMELVNAENVERAIVFARTKHGAERLAGQLEKAGIAADSIHGNKSQNARQRALKAFRNGRVRLLVATDIAARGIDVSGVTHVFNFDLPNEAESYVHRIGRTARAGKCGIAISFCDMDEIDFLGRIEKMLGRPIERGDEHPWHAPHVAARAASRRSANQNGARNGRAMAGKNRRGSKPSQASRRNPARRAA